MKTAISIPTPIFREAERAARTLGVSRSEFFARAAAQLVTALREDRITASYDAAFATTEDEGDAAFRREAARRVLRSIEWDEGPAIGPARVRPRRGTKRKAT